MEEKKAPTSEPASEVEKVIQKTEALKIEEKKAPAEEDKEAKHEVDKVPASEDDKEENEEIDLTIIDVSRIPSHIIGARHKEYAGQVVSVLKEAGELG